MTLEMLDLNLGFRFKVGRLIQDFFDCSQCELKQKIRHHQLITQIKKTILLFILRKKTKWIITGPFNTPVTVIINQP